MVRRKGRKAYLLITFDLETQKVVSTDEIVGPLESYRVKVDWNELCKRVKAKKPDDDPPDPPWTRMAFEDEEYSRERRPWTYEETDDVERPPDV
jgi:hypothetical protein